jgi:hypothetical protein
MCHPPDWATCLLPVFHHVVTDHAVWRLGTPVGKYVTGCVGSKTPEGPKAEYISTVDSRRHTSKDRRLRVKALWEKVQEESLKLLKPEEPKRFTTIDLWEDTRRQIMNSG